MMKLKVKRFEEMNVIPFIDVMLVLLAIVLTTATFVSQGLIPVNLPSSSETQSVAQQDDAVLITINKRKELFFNDTKVSFSQLEDTLAKAETKQAFVLNMDASVNIQLFIRVMDVFKRNQLTDVSIQASQIGSNGSVNEVP